MSIWLKTILTYFCFSFIIKTNLEKFMNLFNVPFVENDVYEYYQNSISKYFEKRKQFKNNNLKYLLKVDRKFLGDDDYIQIVAEYVSILSSYGLKPSDIVMAYGNDYKKKIFNAKELEHLKGLESIAKQSGVTVGILDYGGFYNLEQVKNANEKIKKVANEIKKSNFTPLEKLLYAYLYVSKFVYKSETEQEGISKSRSVYGVLNGDKIVCAGFAELLKAIIDEVGDKNIRIFENQVGCICKDDDTKGLVFSSHQNVIAVLKDDKYKINGYYYCDPTWDSDENELLSYFLIEIKEIKNILNYGGILEMYSTMDKKDKYFDKHNTNGHRVYVQGKNKTNAYSNVGYPGYSSVSKNKFNIIEDEFCDYVLSRPDFVDFIALKETLKSMKKSNLSFDELLEKNYKLANENPDKLQIFSNQSVLWRYLKQNSPHIDIGAIQNALLKVYGVIYPQENKDQTSKRVYETLKTNILSSKEFFCEDSQTMFTECEELK